MPLDTLAFATGRELANSCRIWVSHRTSLISSIADTQEITFPAEYTPDNSSVL